MRHTEYLHPALLATAALDARPARPSAASGIHGRQSPGAAPATRASAGDPLAPRALGPPARLRNALCAL